MSQKKFKLNLQKVINRKFFYYFGLITGGILFLHQIVTSLGIINQVLLNEKTFFYFSLALTGIFLSTGFQIIAWYTLIEKKYNLPFINALSGYPISFIPRYIPGNIWGYMSRSEWLFQSFSIPRSFSNDISVYELSSTITANILLVFINFTPFITETKYFIFLLLIIILIPCIPWFMFKFTNLLLIKHKQNNFITKMFDVHLLTFPKWILNVCLFLVHWSLIGVSLLFLCRSMNINLTIYQTIISSNISWLVGFLIIFAPSGLGYREIILSQLLLNFSTIQLETAYFLPILFRLFTILSEALWIAVGIIIKNFLKLNQSTNMRKKKG